MEQALEIIRKLIVGRHCECDSDREAVKCPVCEARALLATADND